MRLSARQVESKLVKIQLIMEIFYMKANTIWEMIQGGAAAVGAFTGWFLGGLDGLVYVLAAFAVCDYISGIAVAFKNKKLSSGVGAKGIIKKIIMFYLIGGGHLLDRYLFGGGTVLRTALLFWYIANEGLSLIENAANLGVPVPGVFKDALKQIKQKGEKAEHDKKDDDPECGDS